MSRFTAPICSTVVASARFMRACRMKTWAWEKALTGGRAGKDCADKEVCEKTDLFLLVVGRKCFL